MPVAEDLCRIRHCVAPARQPAIARVITIKTLGINNHERPRISRSGTFSLKTSRSYMYSDAQGNFASDMLCFNPALCRGFWCLGCQTRSELYGRSEQVGTSYVLDHIPSCLPCRRVSPSRLSTSLAFCGEMRAFSIVARSTRCLE